MNIELTLEDAVSMVQKATKNIEKYAREIIIIYEQMPKFNYIYYCFYAFDNSAKLFETMLEIDPKNYNSFSLNAPDAFFHCLYGGMASLYLDAQEYLLQTV
ncbi:hypothetical protein [Sporosarcina jiandibaonis]|uniref:hypothetical protein n=1 Tax=Sporosarcina jiandibaonis TaxID=2715535 RepID=UPI001FEBD7A0|nr:hypothetical protein [Sporosarcina jiandibaonis]